MNTYHDYDMVERGAEHLQEAFGRSGTRGRSGASRRVYKRDRIGRFAAGVGGGARASAAAHRALGRGMSRGVGRVRRSIGRVAKRAGTFQGERAVGRGAKRFAGAHAKQAASYGRQAKRGAEAGGRAVVSGARRTEAFAKTKTGRRVIAGAVAGAGLYAVSRNKKKIARAGIRGTVTGAKAAYRANRAAVRVRTKAVRKVGGAAGKRTAKWLNKNLFRP